MNKKDLLYRLKQRIAEIRAKFGVVDLALFGSYARDDAHTDSDVDMIVTFDGPADFDRYMDLMFFLSDLLGLRVDLVTNKALRSELRESVEREAIHVA